MAFRTFIILSVGILLISVSIAYGDAPVGERMEIWYMGNVHPYADNSAGSGYKFVNRDRPVGELPGYNNFGSVVYDPAAHDYLAWRINDTDDTLSDWWRITPEPVFRHTVGQTIVARVKTVSESHMPGQGIGNLGILETGVDNALQIHWGGPSGDIQEVLRGPSATVSGDDGYHIIRATIIGRYYGGEMAPWGTGFGPPDYVNGNLVGQDDWYHETAPAGPEISVNNEVVELTTGGDPEGLSRFAKKTILGEPVDGQLSFEFKIMGLGPGTNLGYTWRVWLLDPDGGDLGAWYGQGNNARPRMGAQAVVGTTVELTGGWDTLKMVVNTADGLTHFYFNGTEVTPALPYTGTPVVGAVQIERWNRPDIPGQVMKYDDFFVNGAPVVGNQRVINVYLDESPTPVLTISPAEPYGDNLDSFAFGTHVEGGAGIGQQDIYFDWITATNRGAFAPGEEVAVLGHSLVPGPPDFVESIDEAKKAPDLSTVVMQPGPVVSAVYFDVAGGPTDFVLEEPDRSQGIRVHSQDYVELGDKVKVYGAIRTVGGDRFIEASAVSRESTGNPVPQPVHMNNRASGGGAYGQQQAPIDDSNAIQWDAMTTVWSDSFSYPDGALVGAGGWTGTATVSQIGVVGGEVKVDAGAATSGNATHVVTSKITDGGAQLDFKARAGVGGGYFIWRVFLNDAAGNELGSWYGHANTAVPRYGGSISSAIPLTGSFADLGIRVNFFENKTEWLYNGSVVWTRSHDATRTDSIGNVNILLMRGGLTNQFMFLDDFKVSTASMKLAEGTSNFGILAKITGKVTDALPTGDYDGYFYVDDGSTIVTRDANGVEHFGIKCRPPQGGAPGLLPTVGDTVVVTGVMGMENGARYFWTLGWELAPL